MKLNNSIMAFLAFGNLTAPEARSRFIERSLKFRSEASPSARNALNRQIDNRLTVSGFQHASKAPISRILPLLKMASVNSANIFETVLGVWRESHAKLEEIIKNFLDNREEVFEKIFLIEDDSHITAYSEEICAAVSEVSEKLPEYEQFEVEIMLLCHLFSQIEVIENDEGLAFLIDSADAESADKNAGEFACPMFVRWLEELRGLPAEADAWNEIEPFIAALKNAAEDVAASREEDAARREIIEAFEEFFDEFRQELEYHDKTVIDNFSDISLESLKHLSPMIADLRSALEYHTDLRRQIPKTNAEDRLRREKLDETEKQIEAFFAYMDSLNDSAETTGAGNRIAAKETEILTDDSFENLDAASTDAEDETVEQISVEEDLSSKPEDSAEEISSSASETVADVEEIATSETDESNDEILSDAANIFAESDEPLQITEPTTETSLEPDGAASKPAADESADEESADALPVNLLTPEQNSAAVAGLILSQDESSDYKRNLIWHLIDEEKYGLAYHLCRCCEITEPEAAARSLPSWLLQTLIVGRRVRFSNGELVECLRDNFAQFSENSFTDKDSSWNYGLNFLIIAAALRPALLAPSSGALNVLYGLKFGTGLENLFGFSEIVRDFSKNSQPLDLSALKKVRDVAAWNAEAKALQARIKTWRELAFHYTFPYAPAKYVWKSWIQESSGMLGKLLAEMEQADLKNSQIVMQIIEKARREAERLSFKDVVDQEIESSRR